MQHSALSRPSAAHPIPPQSPQSRGQHTSPFSLVPSMPGRPLTQVPPADGGVSASNEGRRRSERRFVAGHSEYTGLHKASTPTKHASKPNN